MARIGLKGGVFSFPLTIDEVVQFHPEITNAAALRGVVTSPLQRPVVWTVSWSDEPDADVKWKLRTRGIGEDDDGLSYIVPVDWSATNNIIWVRIS